MMMIDDSIHSFFYSRLAKRAIISFSFEKPDVF